MGCTGHTLVQTAAGGAVGASCCFGPGEGRRDLLRWGCSYPGGPGSLCSAQPDAVLLEEPWVLAFC